MPLGKPRYPFTRRMTDGAPGDAGVYQLYGGARVLYIGRAADLRARLQQHLDGAVCECSRQATHYSWEIVLQPRVRELELLREQREREGALPPCNLHSASAWILLRSGMDREVRQELYFSLLLLGADPLLLGTIERTDDHELLTDLRNWNEAKLAELREWLPTMNGEPLEDAQRRIARYENQRRLLKLAA